MMEDIFLKTNTKIKTDQETRATDKEKRKKINHIISVRSLDRKEKREKD